jgi:hypothetical protein
METARRGVVDLYSPMIKGDASFPPPLVGQDYYLGLARACLTKLLVGKGV